MLKLLSNIPYNFIVVVFMILAHMFGLNMSMTGLGIVFFIAYPLAMTLEFVKSANTDTTAFAIDLLFSVVALVTMTAFITYIVVKEGGNANIVYWFGYLLVLVDAIVSPINSFRAALRDFGGSGGAPIH